MGHSLVLCLVLQLRNSLNAKPIAKLHALGVTFVLPLSRYYEAKIIYAEHIFNFAKNKWRRLSYIIGHFDITFGLLFLKAEAGAYPFIRKLDFICM